jgi:hypothetical protein
MYTRLTLLLIASSSTERKRRTIYRSEIHGQLPFEVKILGPSLLAGGGPLTSTPSSRPSNLNPQSPSGSSSFRSGGGGGGGGGPLAFENVPTLDYSLAGLDYVEGIDDQDDGENGNREGGPQLEKKDAEDFLVLLETLEREYARVAGLGLGDVTPQPGSYRPDYVASGGGGPSSSPTSLPSALATTPTPGGTKIDLSNLPPEIAIRALETVRDALSGLRKLVGRSIGDLEGGFERALSNNIGGSASGSAGGNRSRGKSVNLHAFTPSSSLTVCLCSDSASQYLKKTSKHILHSSPPFVHSKQKKNNSSQHFHLNVYFTKRISCPFVMKYRTFLPKLNSIILI